MFFGAQNYFLPGEYTGQEVYCPIVNILVYLLKRATRKLSVIIRRQSPPQRSPNPKQYSRMIKSIHDIYAQDRTFLDDVASDLEDNAVWFNNSEFARYHNINGRKILSVFTGDHRTQAINIHVDGTTPEGISKSRGILFCRAQEISGVNAEQPLRLDGKMYTVSEARLIQDQVWRIVLEANNG